MFGLRNFRQLQTSEVDPILRDKLPLISPKAHEKKPAPSGILHEEKHALSSPEITDDFLRKLENPHCEIRVLRLFPSAYLKKGLKPLQAQEIMRLTAALKKNTSVQVLDLSYVFNQIEDGQERFKAIAHVASLLKSNKYLQSVFFTGDQFSSEEGRILADHLKSSAIQDLSMYLCGFDSNDRVIEIIQALQGSANLVSMNFHGSIKTTEEPGDLRELKKEYDKMPGKIFFDPAVTAGFKVLDLEQKLMGVRERPSPRPLESPRVFPPLKVAQERKMYGVFQPKKKPKESAPMIEDRPPSTFLTGRRPPKKTALQKVEERLPSIFPAGRRQTN